MTFEQFERRLALVRADIDRATWAHYTTIYINEAGRKSKAIYKQLNRHANFWNYQTDALQCSLFMGLGRLFETETDALTLAKLLNESSRHAEKLFSRSALQARKQRAGLSALQVDDYMQGVTADPAIVLKRLKKHLALPRKIYQEHYQGIRHLVFGHAIAHDSLQTQPLYAVTQLSEVEGILYRANEVIEGLFALAYDGRERDLSTTPPTYPARIRRETFSLLGFKDDAQPT